MAQTLTTENVIAWAARPEHITAFTNDKTVLNIVENFLQGFNKQKIKKIVKIVDTCRNSSRSSSGFFTHSSSNISGRMCSTYLEDRSIDDTDEKMEVVETSQSSKFIQRNSKTEIKSPEANNSERHLLQTFSIVAYECVVKDKITLLPLWINLYKSLDAIEKQPNSYLVWQIKLITAQVLGKSKKDGGNFLLSSESALAIKQRAAKIIDGWEHGNFSLLIDSWLE